MLAAGCILAIPTFSQATSETPSTGGQPIAATPYDNRLNEAGALVDYLPTADTRSADELFLQARSFRYQNDGSSRDHWQTPEETEARWSGDCEDKALWLYAQLKKNGHRGVRLVVGRKDGSSNGFHVWVSMASSDGSSAILDPTAQKRIWNTSDFWDGAYTPLYSFDGLNRYRHQT